MHVQVRTNESEREREKQKNICRVYTERQMKGERDGLECNSPWSEEKHKQ